MEVQGFWMSLMFWFEQVWNSLSAPSRTGSSPEETKQPGWQEHHHIKSGVEDLISPIPEVVNQQGSTIASSCEVEGKAILN